MLIFLHNIDLYLLKIRLNCSHTSHQTYIRVHQLTTLLTEDIFPDWRWHERSPESEHFHSQYCNGLHMYPGNIPSHF